MGSWGRLGQPQNHNDVLNFVKKRGQVGWKNLSPSAVQKSLKRFMGLLKLNIQVFLWKSPYHPKIDPPASVSLPHSIVACEHMQ